VNYCNPTVNSNGNQSSQEIHPVAQCNINDIKNKGIAAGSWQPVATTS